VNMRRSKLEMHIDILKVLAHHGPLKLTHIMYKANVNCSVLKQYLDFLIQRNLIEEQTLPRKETKQELFTRSQKEVEPYSNTSEN